MGRVNNLKNSVAPLYKIWTNVRVYTVMTYMIIVDDKRAMFYSRDDDVVVLAFVAYDKTMGKTYSMN